jgi:hypothetical protein
VVLVFADYGWFRNHRPIVDPWHRRVITVSRRAKKALPDEVELVKPPLVSAHSVTAGHHAIDIAAALGARRVVLLGLDCRTIEGRSHCHDDYPAAWSDRLYAEKILPMWHGWNERMRRKGVEVINATPGSALDEFPGVSLDRALRS